MKTAVLLAALGAPVHGRRRRHRRHQRPGHRPGSSALVFVGGSYWFSDTLAIEAARAKPVTRERAARVYAIVEDLAQRAGMPMPQAVRLARRRSRTRSPPAATRITPRCASPRASSQVLDDDELRGVLAHELSHVKNRDILIGSVAAAVAHRHHLRRPDGDVGRDVRRRRRPRRRQRLRRARHDDPGARSPPGCSRWRSPAAASTRPTRAART